MEDIINMENRATQLCEALSKLCKNLNLSAVIDVSLSMEVSVITAEENVEKIHEACLSNGSAKISNIEKIPEDFCKITISLD